MPPSGPTHGGGPAPRHGAGGAAGPWADAAEAHNRNPTVAIQRMSISLNGDATLSVAFRQTNLTVFINEVNVKGKPLPGIYMDTIRTINWAEGANTNRNGASALNKIQSIDVKDGKLIITPVEAPEKSR